MKPPTPDPQHAEPGAVRPPVWKAAVRLSLAAALALTVLIVAGLAWIGFPQAVTRRLLASVNAGDCFCQVDCVKLDLRGGLAVHNVRVYRKGVTGPPFFEARDLRVLIHPFAPRSAGWSRVKAVSARHGVVRSSFLSDNARVSWTGGAAALAASLRDFDVLGVRLHEAGGLVRLNSRGGSLSRLTAAMGSEAQRGEVQGAVSWSWNGGVEGKLVTALDPHALMPLCRVFGLAAVGRVLEWFSFPAGAPSCDLVFESPAGDPRRWSIKGRVQASDFAYRGAGIGFANVGVLAGSGADGLRIVLDPAMLVVGGRNVSGHVTVDLTRSRTEFEAVSTADIPTLARIVGLGGGSLFDECRFGRGTRLYARGTVGYEDAACNDMEAFVEGSQIGIGRVVADECAFRFVAKGATNLLNDIRGRIAGGSFTGTAALMPGSPDEPAATRYKLTAEVINVEFQRLWNLWQTNAAGRTGGKLYGNIELSGTLGSNALARAAGQGLVTMRQGFVFRLPLFGGMTERLAKALPGLDIALKQTDARMPFEVHDGQVSSRDVQIEGDVLSLTARGNCRFGDGALAFDVQVRPMKDSSLIGQAMRALTYPISRLFEFRLEGTLDDPRWSLFSLPRDKREEGAEKGKEAA